MHRFSSTLLLCLTVISLCAIGFAANPTFNIKSINVAGVNSQIRTADFDNDGNADFVVGTSKGVSVFFGDGTGNFTRVDVGGPTASLQIADVDGDGHPDMIAGDFPTAADAKIVVHRNNGNRTFTALTPFAVTNIHTFSFAAGDFDGDGKADLALSMSQLTVEVMVGNGDGTFQAPRTVFTTTVPADVPDPTSFGIDGVQVAADFDGNGKVDFMASAGPTNLFGGDNIWFMLNQGALTFTPQQFSQQAFFGGVALDGNGDGKADVGFSWVGCHTPCGGGDVWTVASGTPQQIDSASFDDAIQGLPGSPVAADFNGDGQRDIAWSYGTFSTFTAAGATPAQQSVLVHLGPPQVTPASQQTVQVDVGPDDNFNQDAMASADFNNDGAPDIVVASMAHNAIRVMLNTTAGVAKQDYRFTIAPATATVTAGQSATITATLTPTGGFTQQVTFACSGLPADAACSFAPSALVPSNGAAKTTLTISTTARTSGALHRTSTTFFALMLPFVGVGGIVCVAGAGQRKWTRLFMLAALCAVLALTLMACGGATGPKNTTPPPTPPGGGGGGGGGTGTSGTAAGTYTVVVTAQGGGISHATNVTLNVQ